jgi:hypothetical protein
MFLYVGRNKAFDILELDLNLDIKGVKGFFTSIPKNWGFACTGHSLFCILNQNIVQLTRALTIINQCALADNLSINPHQSLAAKDYICFTEATNNCLIIYNKLTKKIKVTHIHSATHSWPNTINYINNQFYIICHNHGPSSLITYDSDFNSCYSSDRYIGYCAHNIWEMHDRLWTCDSYVGDIRTLEGDRTISIGGFTRGIAMTQTHLFVGVSQVRKTNTLTAPAPIKKNKPDLTDGCCGIAIFDIESLVFEKFIPIDDEQIYDIRIVNGRDYARYGDDLVIDLPPIVPNPIF